MKLSKTQQDVVDLMKNGWELGSTMTFEGGCWLQENGCGRGGNTERVSNSTVHALLNKGIICEKKAKFPLRTYKLA